MTASLRERWPDSDLKLDRKERDGTIDVNSHIASISGEFSPVVCAKESPVPIPITAKMQTAKRIH